WRGGPCRGQSRPARFGRAQPPRLRMETATSGSVPPGMRARARHGQDRLAAAGQSVRRASRTLSLPPGLLAADELVEPAQPARRRLVLVHERQLSPLGLPEELVPGALAQPVLAAAREVNAEHDCSDALVTPFTVAALADLGGLLFLVSRPPPGEW